MSKTWSIVQHLQASQDPVNRHVARYTARCCTFRMLTLICTCRRISEAILIQVCEVSKIDSRKTERAQQGKNVRGSCAWRKARQRCETAAQRKPQAWYALYAIVSGSLSGILGLC